MAETRAYSANYHHVQAVAQRALANPSGLIIAWTLDTEPTLEVCKLKARSFQQSFTSFRARDRRMSASNHGESRIPPRDSMAVSDYDRLVCAREMTPSGNGWQIRFIPIADVLKELNIIDPSTGLPLDDIGSNRNEANTLMDEWIELCIHKDTHPPFPDDKLDRLLGFHGHLRNEVSAYRDFRDKGVRQAPAAKPPVTDLANLSDDDLAGWGEGGEEGG